MFLPGARLIRAACLDDGRWQLVQSFTETESGKRSHRPELRRALDYCTAAGEGGGKRLGNPTNLAEAQRKGAATMKAARVFPSIRDIQKRGAPSLHTIAETLNARGITTAQSKRWSAIQLSKLLKRAAEAESVVHHLPGHVQKGFAHAMTKRLS